MNGNPVAGAATTGTTKIRINDLNTGPGGFNPEGILVVSVRNGTTDASNFVIDPTSANYADKFGGVIDKGLFIYDLAVAPVAGGGTGQYLVGVPDQEAFELPSLITGAQTVWHETAGLWLDRQADLRSYLTNPAPPSPGTPVVTKEQGLVTKAPPAAAPGVTPGVWAKAVGSWMSRDNSASYGALGNQYGFDTSYSQDTYGFIAGADFGKTTDSSAWIFGVMGGYVTSSLDFDGSPTSADYSGGTVGVYATYLNGGFFLDALFKADILDLDYSAPTLGDVGYTGESTDATSLGFVLDTGYRIAWTDKLFVEPVATLAYVSTGIDDLVGLSGNTVQFHDGESLRGAIGARVGGRLYETDAYWMEASAVGRLWYEFDGDNRVTLLNTGLPFSVSDDFDGAFGEIGGNLNWFAKTSGWNGFVNANVKFNGDFTSGTALTGLRYKW
nr:autotransporter outer membrane beta-barrel domain-containing protein [Ancylobacter sp. Lp-2]